MAVRVIVPTVTAVITLELGLNVADPLPAVIENVIAPPPPAKAEMLVVAVNQKTI